ncbi:MAG: exodeoxyribonuclease VII large subunit [Clostridia bacterium]|nr:exodeoxyribonuclease VII large subunit [Clostridia bacterium]
MSSSILTVSQLNFHVKSLIESDERLNSIMVRGEISNLNKHYSGHYYFSLKDGQSVVKCVMFRSSASKLRFSAENGMAVIVSGRVSVFERDGQYQLYAGDMQPDGIGSLQLAYEQLKEKLNKMGVFAPEHKRSLPRFPKKVGVITSPTGAAIRDIMNVLGRRYPLCDIVLCPVLVQGQGSEEQLIAAMRRFNDKKAADVIIIGRGGGSIEDLWSFNSERLAMEIYRSEIPVISAVGHETDFTICDFAADMRAPTPSAAAEIAVPDIHELRARTANYSFTLGKYLKTLIDSKRRRLSTAASSKALTSMDTVINIKRERLDHSVSRLLSNMRSALSEKSKGFASSTAKLDALSPLKVLSRGYSIAKKQDAIIKSVNDVIAGEKFELVLSDGSVECSVCE